MTADTYSLRVDSTNNTRRCNAFRYTPCNRGEQTDEEELEDIEVSRGYADSESHTTNTLLNNDNIATTSRLDSASAASSALSCTSGATNKHMALGERRSVTSVGRSSTNSAKRSATTTTTNEELSRDIARPPPGVQRTTSQRQSLVNGPQTLPGGAAGSNIDDTIQRERLIGKRLASSTGRINVPSPCYDKNSASNHTDSSPAHSNSITGANKITRDTTEASARTMVGLTHTGYDNKAHNVDPVTPKEVRKARRKEIQAKFGKMKARGAGDFPDSSTDSSERSGCSWSFVFDPAGRFSYWWSAVVSVAFIYNFWVIVYRFAFEEINKDNMSTWFALDYSADFIYVLDIVFHFRTGYLEDGVLQTDSIRLRIHYMNSTMFYIDLLCLLPLDVLYFSFGFKSIVRCFRLVKIYRFWAFLDRTERHTNYPNLIRTVTLLHYLFAIYHWNACVLYMVAKEQDNITMWKFPRKNSIFAKYLHSLYLSTQVLTTIGALPSPSLRGEYYFVIAEYVFGLLLFSAVLGNVANIVTNISAARKDFQGKTRHHIAAPTSLRFVMIPRCCWFMMVMCVCY